MAGTTFDGMASTRTPASVFGGPSTVDPSLTWHQLREIVTVP